MPREMAGRVKGKWAWMWDVQKWLRYMAGGNGSIIILIHPGGSFLAKSQNLAFFVPFFVTQGAMC